jgi:hypothetical protein
MSHRGREHSASQKIEWLTQLKVNLTWLSSALRGAKGMGMGEGGEREK